MLTRSLFLRALLASLLLPVLNARPVVAAEDSSDTIFNDPDTPVGGNPNGDITIVDFFDYNCPFCKRAAYDLERLVTADGNVKLLYKDWPVLEETSVFGAQLALSARYQDKYLVAHRALMNIPGYGVARAAMLEAVRRSGVDMDRLDADSRAHAVAIGSALKRNLTIADAIGLQGTPGFLIGPFKVNQALTYEQFKLAVSDARAHLKGHK